MSGKQLHTLFVYGSLRRGFQNPAYEYISNYFTLLGPATTPGALYDMGSYPAALPGTGTAVITGELYTIKNENEFDWAIAQIDDYEGLNPEATETPLYRRSTATVQLTDGTTVEAWIYWYNGDITGRPVIESGDVFEFMQKKQP